ncbi:MAG: putative peptidoglycan glycosyltransferase FtsW [bacterium]|nr:putative peptidoglycan glycosyltransferase FtsW [bacterium]
MKQSSFVSKIRSALQSHESPDAWLLWILIGLVTSGFLIFLSASIGLLARDGANFGSVALTRLSATAIGVVCAFIASRYHYRNLRNYSLVLLLASIVLTALVFLPHIGVEHGGARRWILLFGVSFQPSELLKIAFVIYGAAFFSAMKEKVQTISHGIVPLLALLGISGFLLLMQPDTDTFVVLFLSLMAIFITAGARLKHIAVLGLIATIGLGALVLSKPYLKERVLTFIAPQSVDSKGAGWQIEQSLIAIGSGQFMGRGFGQSVQKFSYLPEPIGDSIFAVAGEEFGFVGGFLLIAFFLAFLLRGLRIATRAPDSFSGLLSVGIVILIGASACMNIASMLAIIPLSGLPLAFVSHGGTALVINLIEAGILLNISRYQRA